MNEYIRERLWIFDFDGTISPIVPLKEHARLHPVLLIVMGELSAIPLQRVAVLSSRRLEDLIKRIPVSGVYLGGSSGIEWQFPNGNRFVCEDRQKLEVMRGDILPILKEFSSLPGIELEDKEWSVALHTRRADPEVKEELLSQIEKFKKCVLLDVMPGPEVLEIPLIPGIDKAYGVKALCRLLKFNPTENKIVYAGDDTNDACAMRWIDQQGGVTITVGGHPLIPGSRVVRDQIVLAEEIRLIAGLPPSNGKKNNL